MGVLPDPDKCHDGNLEPFEKFKVKVYSTGVKFEICVGLNRLKTFLSHVDSENIIVLPTSNFSVLSN